GERLAQLRPEPSRLGELSRLLEAGRGTGRRAERHPVTCRGSRLARRFVVQRQALGLPAQLAAPPEALGCLPVPSSLEKVLGFFQPFLRICRAYEEPLERRGRTGIEPRCKTLARPERRSLGRLVNREVAARARDRDVEMMERPAARGVLPQ